MSPDIPSRFRARACQPTTSQGLISDMTKKRAAALATALVAVVLIGANVLPSAAQRPPPPIATELLTGRAAFTDDVDLKLKIKLDGNATRLVNAKDPSRTLMARFTVQPGAQFPWHSHAGPVIVNVTSGELVYVDADDCKERAYPAGTAFVDAGRPHPHRLQCHRRRDGHRGHLLRSTRARTAAHPRGGARGLQHLAIHAAGDERFARVQGPGACTDANRPASHCGSMARPA